MARTCDEEEDEGEWRRCRGGRVRSAAEYAIANEMKNRVVHVSRVFVYARRAADLPAAEKVRGSKSPRRHAR